jgi:hypothetical protein
MIKRTFILFAILSLLTSCKTIQQLPGLGNAIKRDGQLKYSTRNRTLFGDFVLRSSQNGDYDLAFLKSDITVLQLQAHGNALTATGILARGGWTGPINRAPGSLRNWATLKQILPYFEKPQNASGPTWAAAFDRSKTGNLERCKIQFKNGNSLIFNFSN